jgi:hypothetical protein
MDKEALRQILAGGKDCSKIQQYREAYKELTGKEYGGGCTSCACRYLFTWLSSYINIKE